MPKITELNRLLSYMAFRIFKPLIVLFLRNSVPYQTASDWLKRIYVDVAFENKEFRINPEKKQTKTRVAILTGLSRVEIDRVLKIEKPLEVTVQKWNRATKVLSGWSNDSRYISQNGQPKDLPIYGKHSFSSLVDDYSGGATMRSVLDELVHVGSAEVSNENVRLLRTDYAPTPNKAKLIDLEFYGIYIGELLNTITYNDIEVDEDKKRFQKMVFHRTIPESNKEEAIDFIKEKTDVLLTAIDHKLSELAESEISEPTTRLGLGTYYFEEVNHEKN
jgi:hypothetical protein